MRALCAPAGRIHTFDVIQRLASDRVLLNGMRAQMILPMSAAANAADIDRVAVRLP